MLKFEYKPLLYFPAIITKCDDVFSVEIKNDATSLMCSDTLYTQGFSLEHALYMGRDCILTLASALIKEREIIPSGNVCLKGKTHDIRLKEHEALKMMLHNLIIRENYSQKDLCTVLQLNASGIDNILNLYHETDIDIIARCFLCIGHPLDV